MALVCDVEAFFQQPGVIIDVRSPLEYAKGRISGALSLPLFTDQERALVGTTYKQQGKDPAVFLGLQLTGPKLAAFVTQAQSQADSKALKIYCWRGGMRSGAMGWLMELAGFRVATLKGGYKAYRKWCHRQFERSFELIVIGGMTGCGKTEALADLKERGEQVIDLEALACHRGSAFGRVGILEPQPSTEQFENAIGEALARFDLTRPVWIENESRLIGTCHLPIALSQKMASARLEVIERPREERIQRLLKEYGGASPEELIAAIGRIEKHLGRVRAKSASEAIQQGDLAQAIALVLDYYDSTYSHGLRRRNPLS